MNKIDWCNNERECLIYMFRYCLTRRSYAVSTAIQIITKNWQKLSVSDRKLIHKGIVEHFELYNPAEKYDMDEHAWGFILELPIEENPNE